MTAEKTYQSLRADVSSRIEQKLKELQALTADDIIDMYKAEAEKLSVLDGKYPGTGGIRTFITGRDKFTYDFIDLDKYYIKDEVDEMLAEEKKEREDADDDLDKRMTDWEERLQKEIDDRIAGDEDLLNQLDAEIERAKEVESDLQDQINAEVERATNAEEELNHQINGEVARAKAAEADLQDQLNKEIERATGIERDLQKQLDDEIARAEKAEETEVSERQNADNRLVDWAKSHFMDTLITIGDSPLTLETSYNYDSDGYKVYTIHGTVDCYSKGEINELVDNLEQADSLLQSNIDNVLSVLRSDIDNVQSGINNLQASMQSQIDAITSNYITSIGCDTTSPLFLSASKNGNSVIITGHVDLGDYYTKSEVDSLLADITSSLGDCVTEVKASGTGRLTLSASKSGSTVTISGSVTDLSFDAGITSVTTKNTSSDDLSNVFSISESTSNGTATISAGINSDNLKSWLDNNGYGGGDTPTTSGVSSVQITSSSLSITQNQTTGEVVVNIEGDGSSQTSINNIWFGLTTSSISNTEMDISRSNIYPSGAVNNPSNGDIILVSRVSSLNSPVCLELGVFLFNTVGNDTCIITKANDPTWSFGSTDLSNYYTKSQIDEMLDQIKAGDVDLSGYQKKLNYYHENVDENSDVVFAHITANAATYTLSDGTSVTSPNLAQYRLLYMKSGYALSGQSVWWTTDYDGKEVTLLQLVVKCVNETKQPRTIFNAYPDFFEWVVDQEKGSDYEQRLVLDRNGLWLDGVKLGAGDESGVSGISCTGDDYLTLTASPSTGNVNITGTVDINKIGPNVFPTVSTSIPTDITLNSNQLYTGSISSNTTISFHTTDSVAGAEVQIIIQATSAATVSLTGTYAVFTDGYSSIDVASGKYLEINAIYDGSRVYVRSGYSE